MGSAAVSLSLALLAGSIASVAVDLGEGEAANVRIAMGGMEAGRRYEMRVSWPAIAPVRNVFVSDFEMDVSDEKMVFAARSSEENVTVVVTGIGKNGRTANRYRVPLNFSLERQYYGLTSHVWKLIAWMAPVLAVSVAAGARLFGLSD